MIITMVILFLCLIRLSDAQKEPLFPNSDKFIHAGMHFTLVAAVLFDLQRINFYGRSVRSATRAAFLYSFFLGLFIEILQHFMGLGRSFDPFDLMANILGALLAAVVGNSYLNKRLVDK